MKWIDVCFSLVTWPSHFYNKPSRTYLPKSVPFNLVSTICKTISATLDSRTGSVALTGVALKTLVCAWRVFQADSSCRCLLEPVECWRRFDRSLLIGDRDRLILDSKTFGSIDENRNECLHRVGLEKTFLNRGDALLVSTSLSAIQKCRFSRFTWNLKSIYTEVNLGIMLYTPIDITIHNSGISNS